MSEPKWGEGLDVGWTQPLTGITLMSDLVSHWKLDEISGNRLDSVGENHLIPINNVAQADGKIGNAAQFTLDNSEYLTVVNSPGLATGDVDFTIAEWVNLDTKGTLAAAIANKGNLTGGWEWYLFWLGSFADRFQFQINEPGGAPIAFARAESLRAPKLNTWYFVVGWYDSAARTVNIQVDNGEVNSVSASKAPTAGTGPFNIGSDPDITAYLDGRADSVSFWKRVLTTAERTALFNKGEGLDFVGNTTDGVPDWQGVAVTPFLEHLPFTAGGVVMAF